MQPMDKKVGKKIPFTTKNLGLFRPIFLEGSLTNADTYFNIDVWV